MLCRSDVCPTSSGDLPGLPAERRLGAPRAYLPRANLSNADLHGAVLNLADLADANLSRADLIGASLSGATLHLCGPEPAPAPWANPDRSSESGPDWRMR